MFFFKNGYHQDDGDDDDYYYFDDDHHHQHDVWVFGFPNRQFFRTLPDGDTHLLTMHLGIS